ncbi:MAG TPA: MFS transporter [Methanolinea sp.]|mgnify:FL=1|nr:MFS transporter [Methanolinea sp.]HQK55977.1 MFS transporter [Methanolinea sp.]
MAGSEEKRILLIVSSLASFLVPYTVSSLNVALPAISGAFGLDAITLGWVTSVYMLTAAVCIVPFGKIADIYGRKRVFLAGNLLFVAGSLFAAVSWAGYALIAARIVQGLGGAMVFSTSIAIITAVFSPGERGRAIGIVTATVYAGLSLGPFLGGILTQHAGWPSIFLVNVPLGLAVITLTLLHVPGEWAESEERAFDFPGSVLYGLMLIGCIYGLTLLPSLSGLLWMAAGLLLLSVFWWWERRSSHPVLDPSLFSKNPIFLYSNLAALINYAVVFAVGFLLSLYLQFIRGMDPQTAGIVLVAQPVVQTLVSPAAGHLSDSIDPRILATVGMGLSTAGLGILALLSPDTPVLVIVGGLVILGLGYGLFSSPNTNAIMSSVSVRHLGIASGMVSTMRAIGQMVSLAIAMMVFSLVIGNVQISPEVYPQLQESVNLAFSVFFVLGLIGIWASFSRGRTRTPK